MPAPVGVAVIIIIVIIYRNRHVPSVDQSFFVTSVVVLLVLRVLRVLLVLLVLLALLALLVLLLSSLPAPNQDANPFFPHSQSFCPTIRCGSGKRTGVVNYTSGGY